MGFRIILVILSVVLFKINAKKHVASDFTVLKNCFETQPIRTQAYLPYEEIQPLKEWSLIGKNKTLTKYRYEIVERNKTKSVCCEGYQNFNENECIPVCTMSCGSEGVCSLPDYCTCNEGYKFDIESKKCQPYCTSECTNGVCTSPDVCTCLEGYRMLNDNHTCEPVCQNEANSCIHHEFCAEPGVCRCIPGYARQLLDRDINSDVIQICQPLCDEECINGECVAPNVCKCHENYTRVDMFMCERMYFASNFTVPKLCTETKTVNETQQIPYKETYIEYEMNYDEYSDEISPVEKTRILYKTEHVLVNKTTSICCDGYQNYDESNCIPVCSNHCGPHGICSKPDVCLCDEGYILDEFDRCQPVCQSECVNGVCTSPNYCTCNEGYRKIDDYNCVIM